MQRHGATFQSGGGFTIVELLVVIVVIALLASIAIIGYSGIQQQARTSAMSAELGQIGRAVELYKASSSSGRYPSSLTDVKDIRPKSNTQYFFNSNENTYCIEMTEGSVTQSLGRRSGNREGRCSLNGLVAWFPMNGSPNEVATNQTVTVTGSPVYGTGANGTANGAYIVSPSDALRVMNAGSLPSSMGAMTISAWANGGNDGQYTYLVHRGADNTIGSSIYWLGSLPNNRYGAGINGKFSEGNSGIVSGAGTWRHVVVTYDGSQQIIYVDGQERQRATIGAVSNTATNNDLSIGSGSTSNYRSFIGSIDDVRVYNRTLTSTEVANLYDIGAY